MTLARDGLLPNRTPQPHSHPHTRKLDLIGTTEAFDDFMISMSVKLGWPLDWVTYKRLKTVLDRPKVADHSAQVSKSSVDDIESLGPTPYSHLRTQAVLPLGSSIHVVNSCSHSRAGAR